jgi:hypothetical protein
MVSVQTVRHRGTEGSSGRGRFPVFAPSTGDA